MADDVNNQDPNNNTGSPDNGATNTQTVTQTSPDQPTAQELEQKRIQDALMLAVQDGDRVRLEQLIAQGADVNRLNPDGTTAIGDAVAGNDKNISRDFLQQTANGNVGYDPTLDPTLTGLTTGTSLAAGVTDVGAAVGLGLTADEAAAMGNFALAAQLAAQEDFAQEALEANDKGSEDLSDGDFSYAASVASMDGWDNSDDDDPYAFNNDDYYGDDDDLYGYDDEDYYGDDYADYSLPSGSGTANGYDPTLTGSGTNGPQQSSFLSSFLSTTGDVMALDLAATGMGTGLGVAALDTSLGVTALNTALDPTLTATSSFFDMSAPLTGTSVWNTSFFDPASIDTGTGTQQANNNTLALNTTPTIAPTNPYYRPSSGGSSMAM